MAKNTSKSKQPPFAAVTKPDVRPPSYEPERVDIKWWKTSTLKPLVVMAQLEAMYQQTPGPIRHDPDVRYTERLFGVIDFARRRKADFCVFPEFSWPEATAAELWERLKKYKAPCVFVLPFEHVTARGWLALLEVFKVGRTIRRKEQDEIERMMPFHASDGWVNGAMVVVRTTGRMRAYPQRKLRPALLEERGGLETSFVKGSTIRVFESANCTFAVLICFDFISRDLGLLARPCDVLTTENPRLDLLIVPECNPQPLHDFYLKTIIDLYQTPAWAQRRPVLVFNNVAVGTRLANIKGFGFSRLIGNLGAVATSEELLVIDGYVAADEPKSLADIQKTRTVVRGKRTRTLIFRPEQSVFSCDLPPFQTGASGDRQASSLDTYTEIFRPVGPQLKWQAVRDVHRENPPSSRSAAAMKLAGAAELQAKFRRMIDEETLLVVKGAEGFGKTALVATTVRDVLRPGVDRLVWVDLAQIEHTESALVEEVLLRLGRAEALAYSLDRQYQELIKIVRVVPTILVLDSADSWGEDPIPEQLLRLHGWKTLVVVAGRYQPAAVPQSTRVFEVTPLTPQDFTAVVEAAAHVPVGDSAAMLVFVMYVSSGGSALVAVWTGQFIARNRTEAEKLSAHFREAGDRYLGAIRKQIDHKQELADPRAQLERIERVQPPVTLDGIYDWFRNKLNAAELDILDVLCEMPAGLRTDDLARIVSASGVRRTEEEVAHFIDRLLDRNLVQTILPDGDNDVRHAQHQGHPFVRHLWAASNPTLELRKWEWIVDWATWVLDQYHPQHDPRVSPINVNQWPNLAHVLRTLARGGKQQQKRFLELWRKADGFLWAAGRWRERLSFGRAAETAAHEIGDIESEIVAIYDAQAETTWFRSAERDVAERLLDRAAQLAREYARDDLGAHIEWYRSRMLLHLGENQSALAAALAAAELAHKTDDRDVQVMAGIAVGNAHRETGEYELALVAYNHATDLIANIKGSEADKTRAMIDRNRGRVYIRKGERADAIRILEDAMVAFHLLELYVLEAETAVYYAEALAKIGEAATARRNLEWGRQRLDPLGSKVLQRDIARVEHEIEEVMLRR